jgi:hypothetical protein
MSIDEEFPLEATALFPNDIFTEKIEFRFEIQESTSSTVENELSGITVSPNPVIRGGQMTIHTPDFSHRNGDFILSWIDVNGRLMTSANYSEQMIISNGSTFRIPEYLPAGVYFLNIKNAQISTTRKILVME